MLLFYLISFLIFVIVCYYCLGNPDRILSYTISNPASQLRVWAEAFTATLSGRRCHYVTCLSPNRYCQPNLFDTSFVQQQVRWFR